MKLERKHKLRIVVVIAVLLILYGILDGIFSFNIDPKTVSNVSMVFMVIAFALLFSGRGKKYDTINKTDESNALQENPNQTEIESSTEDTTAQIEESGHVEEKQVEQIDDSDTK